MSAPDRRAMLDRADRALSLRRQCTLLGVARSGVYRPVKPANDNDAALMRRIDELFTAWPFLGSRRMTVMLRAEGEIVNRKRVQRLMRLMGIAALGPKPRTSKPRRPQDLSLSPAQSDDRAGEPRVGGRHHLHSDRRGFLYLVAIIDWASRCSGGGCRTRWTFRSVWRRSRRRWRVRQAGDFQHRSGLAVHLGRLHRRARRSGRRDLHGWPRKLDGQCVHRAAVAIAQVRGCLSQGLRQRPGRSAWPRSSQARKVSACNIDGLTRSRSPNRRKWLDG